MIKRFVRRLADHPRRWPLISGGTFALGLITLLPLADEYQRAALREEALSTHLEGARQLAQGLEQLALQTQGELGELHQTEARTVSAERIQQYRGEVVSLVRESGCQLQRIATGAVTRRPWLQKDDPLRTRQVNKSEQDRTGYELTAQPFTLTVTGNMRQIEHLLNRLQQQNCIAHTRSFALRPAGGNRNEITLDLELLLFDLADETNVSA